MTAQDQLQAALDDTTVASGELHIAAQKLAGVLKNATPHLAPLAKEADEWDWMGDSPPPSDDEEAASKALTDAHHNLYLGRQIKREIQKVRERVGEMRGTREPIGRDPITHQEAIERLHQLSKNARELAQQMGKSRSALMVASP